MELIYKYFPNLTKKQLQQFEQLEMLYQNWNQQINVISRKDINHLYERHVIHSLGIAVVQPFLPGSKILDVGTGGGFPGIPLAILFPETEFLLIDSIAKKIKVVKEVASALQLTNVKAEQIRAELVKGQFDFIISRAVTHMEIFSRWIKRNVAKEQRHALKNGILYLKGGDLTYELQSFHTATIFQLNGFFDEPFFESKKVVHVPLIYKHLAK